MMTTEKENHHKKTFQEKEAKSYLQQIINNSKDIIITTNNEGRIVQFNQEAEEQLGYKKDETVNRPVSILWQDPAEREKLMKSVRKYGVARNEEVCLLTKNGKIKYMSLTLSQLKNDLGEVVGTVGISKDISKERMLRNKLLQSEKMAGFGTLASGIAHEINNPLAGILGMAEAIMDENDPTTIKSFTKDIIDFTLEASDIVKELSNYFLSASNDSVSTIDLGTVIKNSLNITLHSFQLFKKIEIKSDLKNECWVNANSGEMQQVFTNLITNAIHAMEKKGGKLSLTCSSNCNFVKSVISDTGIGIKKDHLNQIFDPFFTTKPPGKGTGLGLYVIYNIVSKYMGNIETTSEEGEGTTITITLPAVPGCNNGNSSGNI